MCPSKLKNFDEVNLQIQENGKFDKKLVKVNGDMHWL